jgi:DNA-binding LacI/PurR family transcriptional regulator
MVELLRANGESTFKKESIVSHIRHQIVEGELSPGVQLPTRNELERRYQVSRDTVQRALDRLAEEEFVYTNGRRGTYVSKHPPHLSHYALVFESHPGHHDKWTQFESTLFDVALQRPESPEQKLAIYHDVGQAVNCEAYQQLEEEVANHRLAGLIFAFNPIEFQHTPLMQDPRVARVSIFEAQLSIPTVSFSMFSFIDRALDFVVARGRRRIALISHQHSGHEDNLYFAAGVQGRGLQHRPYWMQTANVRTAQSAKECAHLLMHPNQFERPDALIIDNDNLVEPAIRGLFAAGVRVPDDVEVVAHANFPVTDKPAVPITRLGFDMRQIMNACFESMLLQQQNRPVPPCITVGTMFDSEAHPTGH